MGMHAKDSVPGAVPTGDVHERAGLGLLSRFVGAVFLILLVGLLLLDRALLRADRSEAKLDAQASALLTESYIADAYRVVGGFAVALRDQRANSLDSLAASLREIEAIWVRSSTGDSVVYARGLVARNDLEGDLTTVPARTATVRIVRLRNRPAGLLIQRPIDEQHQVTVLLDNRGLSRALGRLTSSTRIALSIESAEDTLIAMRPTIAPRGQEQATTLTARTIRLPTGGTWTLANAHALTSRNLRWALWSLGVLGTLLLAIGLLREQKRALHAAGRSSELERLYSDVKRANQAKSEFLANISHELRTPLNAIVGFVELLREGFYGDLSPRQVPPVDRIAASATHLRHLVDQVLDIAKIAAGRLEVHAETIVLRPFVLNVASELESLVSEKNLAFSISVGASLPRVRTDPSHLRQVLINLIGNAVKYTDTGTISVRARLRSDDPRLVGTPTVEQTPQPPKPGTWIALQVADTGIGIAAGDLERIFDEFEQVNAGPRGESMRRGTGLGLPISRRLARLLGGEIGVESELGRGSTFTIWLPVNAADIARDPAPLSASA